MEKWASGRKPTPRATSRTTLSAPSDMKTLTFILAFTSALLLSSAVPGLAQTPNTASLLVTVVDQNDATVPGARVAAKNLANGTVREGVSGLDGTALLVALSINGAYNVTVSMQGFVTATVDAISLRAGETAGVRL